jgi:hypothetical protein
MARDNKKKVKSRASTKYATSSDDEDNLLALFANLNMQQKEKINELIGAIHEEDELLDSQEDFLIKENKKHVKVKNAYAQEVEKCEKLTNELSTIHHYYSSSLLFTVTIHRYYSSSPLFNVTICHCYYSSMIFIVTISLVLFIVTIHRPSDHPKFQLLIHHAVQFT